MASVSQMYKEFRGQVALHRKAVGVHKQYEWSYFDAGEGTPLVMLPGAGGTCDCFFKQVTTLSAKGYRVVAVNPPPIFFFPEFVASFDRFLDTIGVDKIHLFGTALGGFLAQIYTQERTERVSSLILCNTFCDSSFFAEQSSCIPFFSYMPEFFLKKVILDNFPQGELDPGQLEAVDFMVKQVEKLTRQDLAARLTLNTSLFTIDLPKIANERVTIVQMFDACSTPGFMIDQLAARYPDAKLAHLKSGGDFPYLSRSAEFNMMLELHMRKVEGRPLKTARPREAEAEEQGEQLQEMEETTSPGQENND